jgi:hypothetical protein
MNSENDNGSGGDDVAMHNAAGDQAQGSDSSLLKSVKVFLSGGRDDDAADSGTVSMASIAATNMRLADFASTVSPLLDFLKISSDEIKMNSSTTNEDDWFSSSDVAKLVLPPAVKQIVYIATLSKKEQGTNSRATTSASIDLQLPLWKAAFLSIQCIRDQESDTKTSRYIIDGPAESAVIESTLTSGALNKMIPYAIKMIFSLLGSTGNDRGQENENSRNTPQGLAQAISEALVAMLSYFHPNNAFDSLCRTLQTIVQLANDVPKTKFNRDIIAHLYMGFLEAVQTAMETQLNQIGAVTASSSSAKAIFTTITSESMLTALSMIHCQAIEHPCTESESLVQLLRDILLHGLFHPETHVEGFRECDTEKRSNVDTSPKQKKRRKKKKNPAQQEETEDNEKRSLCYQQTLFSSLTDIISRYRSEIKSVLKLVPLLFDCFIQQSFQWQANQLHPSARSMETKNAAKKKRTLSEHASAGLEGEHSRATKLQFHYWTCLMQPVISIVFPETDTSNDNECCRPEALRTLQKTLVSISAHDIYLPVYDETEKHSESNRKATLRHLSESLLHSTLNILLKLQDNGLENPHEKHEPLVEALGVLRSLMELNYELFHTKLEQIIHVAALSFAFMKDTASCQTHVFAHGVAEARKLMVCVIVTYGKLRRVDYLVSKLLLQNPAKGDDDPSDHEEKIVNEDTWIHSSLCRTLKDKEVSDSVAQNVCRCPQGQVDILWKICSGFLSSVQHMEGPAYASQKISLGVTMLALLAQSVKVDGHTADKIMKLCVETTDTTVDKLVGNEPQLVLASGGSPHRDESVVNISGYAVQSSGTSLDHGLQLWGAIVDLHTRCSFWSSTFDSGGTTKELDLVDTPQSKGIYLLLEKVIQLTCDEKKWREQQKQNKEETTPSKNELSLSKVLTAFSTLAFHRMQQLHAVFFRERQIEYVNDDTDSPVASKSQLSEEMGLLVEFVFALSRRSDLIFGEQCTERSHSVSILLAQTVALWSPYAEQEQVDHFLRWILKSVARQPTTKNDSEETRRTNEAFLTAQSLLCDVTFLETDIVRNNLPSLAMKLALGAVRNALFCKEPKSLKKDTLIVQNFVVDGQDVLDVSIDSTADFSHTSLFNVDGSVRQVFASQLQHSVDTDIVSTENQEAGLRFATRLLKLIQTLVAREAMVVTVFPMRILLQLHEIISAFVVCTRRDMGTMTVEIVLTVVCRNLIAACLDQHSTLSEVDSQFIEIGVQNSCTKSWFISPPLLKASASLLGACIARGLENALRRDGKSEGIVEAFDWLTSALRSRNKEKNQLWNVGDKEKIQMASPSLRILSLLCQTGRKDMMLVFDAHIETKSALVKMLEAVIVIGRGDEAQSDPGLLFVWTDIMFLTNAIDISGATIGEFFCHAKVQSIISESPRNDAFFAFLAASCSHPRRKVVECIEALQIVFHFLEGAYNTNDVAESLVIDAAICSIITTSPAQELQVFLTAKLKEVQSPPKAQLSQVAALVHTLHLSLTTASRALKSALHIFTEPVFYLALDVLRRPQTLEKKSIALGTRMATTSVGFLIDIVAKKELSKVNGRKIAIVLSRVATLFVTGSGSSSSRGGTKHIMAASLFCKVCSLMSVIVKQYPAKVGDSRISFFAVMQLIFKDVMETLNQSHAGFSEKAMEFGRLCELFPQHKDTLGRDIVGLLLEFSRSLEKGLSSNAFKYLLPGVYSLLDSCSQFEFALLNSWMDTESKVLFRSVFTVYKNSHQYKGQF